MRAPTSLTVLFDGECSFCIEAMSWMQRQPTYIPFTFLTLLSESAREQYGDVLKRYGTEQFIVVSDTGSVYVGTKARIMCLYALRSYRALSIRLSQPPFLSLADGIFEFVSKRRHHVSSMLTLDTEKLAALVGQPQGMFCTR